MNIPLDVGVPLMVIVLLDHAAVTPAGKPVAEPIPVAPVVVCVMFVMAEFKQTVGLELAALNVLAGVTVRFAEDDLVPPQPPDIVYMILQTPAEIAVTTPVVAFIEATDVLLDVQVPLPPPKTAPTVVKFPVLPEHKLVGPVTDDIAAN